MNMFFRGVLVIIFILLFVTIILEKSDFFLEKY